MIKYLMCFLFFFLSSLPVFSESDFSLNFIFSETRQEQYISRDIFPPLYRHKRTYDEEYSSHRFFFPAFHERDEETSTTHVFYPLYNRFSTPRLTRHSFTPLAIYRTYQQHDFYRRRWGVFPLIRSDFMRYADYEHLLKRYLFPFYYYKNHNVASLVFPSEAKVQIYFPFYTHLKFSEDTFFRSYLLNLLAFDASPAYRRISFLYPFFTYSYDKNTFVRLFPFLIYSRTTDPFSSQYTSVLWPLYIHSRSPGREARIIFPFYLRFVTEKRDFESRFIFYLRDEFEGVYERQFYFFPFLGREEGEDYTKTHFLYPLGYRRREETARETRLRGLFSFYRDPPAQKLEWSFLFGLFRYERKPGGREVQITPLIRYQRKEEELRSFLIPLIQRESSPDYERWRFLGPLFTTEVDGYENTLGHYLRLYNREKTEEKTEGDALFRLLEWQRGEEKSRLNINLILFQLTVPWFQ